MKAANEFISDMTEKISMPEVYEQIRQLIETPHASIMDFVKVIENDSMLSTRIIRIANSHFWGFHRQAEDLYQAISLIGVIQLHDLVLSHLCMRTFASIPPQVLNLEAFWKYGLQCGIAAKIIAQYSKTLPDNLYFTLGLLHEIGHAVMFLKSPDLALQALEESQLQAIDIADIERELFGFDYTQAGTALMQFWRLPEIYQQAANHHLHPVKAEKDNRHAVEIVHLAHAICQKPVAGQHQELIDKARSDNDQFKRLPDNIDEIIFKEIDANADRVLHILWANDAQHTPILDKSLN